MIIYKTINLINKKFYIGKDSKNNPRYLGSGIILNRAISKYGKENFIKEILEECSTLIELSEREIYWIKELNATDTKIGYNIAVGGHGGDTWTNQLESKKDEIRKKSSERMLSDKNHLIGIEPWNKNRKGIYSKEHIQKLKEHHKDVKGENNPMFGKNNYECWVMKYGINKANEMKLKWNESNKKANLASQKARAKVILKFDLEMNIIDKYKSMKEARKYNFGDIGPCCRGKQKTAGGYIYKYEDDYNASKE